MKSGDTIDTAHRSDRRLHRMWLQRIPLRRTGCCVKTPTGAWGTSSCPWTCGLSKVVEPRQLSEFVGVSPSCDTEPTCSATCSTDNGILSVTHGTRYHLRPLHPQVPQGRGTGGCTCECA
jgi:hypothetical protein